MSIIISALIAVVLIHLAAVVWLLADEISSWIRDNEHPGRAEERSDLDLE